LEALHEPMVPPTEPRKVTGALGVTAGPEQQRRSQAWAKSGDQELTIVGRGMSPDRNQEGGWVSPCGPRAWPFQNVKSALRIQTASAENEARALTDLPAGIIGESSDLHAMGSAARARSTAAFVTVSAALLTVTGATGELDREALAHEVGSILRCR
jgi:hypothetical protein